MFNHTYNASQVETEVVPTAAGRYTVIIDQVAEKISKNSGKDMLELKLKIIAAEAPEHKRFVGRVLYVYIVDDQYADQKIYDIFTSAGKQVPATVDGKAFVGLVGRVATKLENYNGEPRASVNYWIKPKPGEPPPEQPKPPANSADDVPF